MHAPDPGCYWFNMLLFLSRVCGSFCPRLNAVCHYWCVLQVRKIDRKLKACHNPLLDPESEIFKQQAAAAKQQVKEDRDSKVDLQDVSPEHCATGSAQACSDECGIQQAAQSSD